MRSRVRRRAGGFAAIELALAIASVALLASVAIPALRTLQLRARQAERATVIAAVHAAITEYHARHGRYPQERGGGLSSLALGPNPDATPGPGRRPFRTGGADHWRDLGLVVEGELHYSYRGGGFALPPARFHWIEAAGDLDGNGVQDRIVKEWQYASEVLVRAPGSAAADCSWEQRTPAAAAEF